MPTLLALIDHLKADHNQQIEIEQQHIDSIDEFKSWKEGKKLIHDLSKSAPK